MSIWSTVWYMSAWDVDTQPRQLTAIVAINTAKTWNACIRLDITEDPDWRRTASAMLDRGKARELGKRLLQFADGDIAGLNQPERGWFAGLADHDVRNERCPWQPYYDIGGECFALPVWFASKAECERFILVQIGAEPLVNEEATDA